MNRWVMLVLLLTSCLLVAGMGPAYVDSVLADGQPGPFFLPGGSAVEGASVVVHPETGAHAAYSSARDDGAGRSLAYYAHCAAACEQVDAWDAVGVAEVGNLGGHVRLALDGEGRPRMMWYARRTADTVGTYVYATCDAACLSPASWTKTPIRQSQAVPQAGRYFALDAAGWPRFFYTDSAVEHAGAFMLICDNDCARASNWVELPVSDSPTARDFSLAFDAANWPYVAYRETIEGSDALVYLECDGAGCTGSVLRSLGAGAQFALRVDSLGRPRLALYHGDEADDRLDSRLSFLWCNSSCGDPDSWRDHLVDLPALHGEDVELVIDGADRPHLAYHLAGSADALGYARCTASCESQTPVWQSRLVETAEQLNADEPIPVETGCTLSTWRVGEKPSLAVDATGAAHIAYEARHVQGGGCDPHADRQHVRYTVVAPGADEFSVHLPFLRRAPSP